VINRWKIGKRWNMPPGTSSREHGMRDAERRSQ
jgi:hypothetical protein